MSAQPWRPGGPPTPIRAARLDHPTLSRWTGLQTSALQGATLPGSQEPGARSRQLGARSPGVPAQPVTERAAICSRQIPGSPSTHIPAPRRPTPPTRSFKVTASTRLRAKMSPNPGPGCLRMQPSHNSPSSPRSPTLAWQPSTCRLLGTVHHRAGRKYYRDAGRHTQEGDLSRHSAPPISSN